MTFEEYQEKSRKTALYPSIGHRIVYPTLGLVGEAGEISNKVKKIFRDDNSVITEEKKTEIRKELGDVLWYLAQISTELNLSLDQLAQANIERLYSRMERGTLHGNGDNR
jgi:NTP pyrophosphatase (non-canonical NTP hydrolase)